MVAVLEVVFLAFFLALGAWWFRRTPLYRAHRRSVVDRAQDTPQNTGGNLNGLYNGGSPDAGGL
jgi:hypothetical protein